MPPKMSPSNPLKTEADYEVAIRWIDHLLNQDPEPGSREGQWLLSLTEMVEEFEDVHYPMD